MRSAEYVAQTSTRFDSNTLLVSDVSISSDHSRLFINLRVSKVDPFRHGTIIRLFRLDSPLCPVQATISYLAIIPVHNGPMFQFQNGTYLTRQYISSLLQ